MEAATATAMDFHALSRRELQALCKRNGIRANMTNVAMAEALQGLTTVDGAAEIGTTLCLPTPGRPALKSAMKSVVKTVPVEEQQHGSPLPRGRRVSVISPEAIRMEVEGREEGEVKEIVKTPGVALRGTRRGSRATPAPLPTPTPAGSSRATARRTAARKTGDVVPTPATRRSQRTAARKAAGAVEADRPAEDVPEEKTSKMMIALDLEAEVESASMDEKVQQDEPKVVVSDVKCDDPKEEEEGQQEEPKAVALDLKCDHPEAVEVANSSEADSSDATPGYAAVSVEEEVVVVMEEQSTKSHEGIVKEQDPISVERSAHLTAMDDSPIRGVIEKEQDASVEDCEDLAEFSPARETTAEIIPVTEDKEKAISEEALTEDNEVAISEEAALTEDKEVAISEEALTEDKEVAVSEEAVEEDSFANTVETEPTPNKIFLTAAGEDETVEDGEVILAEFKKGANDEMPQAGDTSEEDEEDCLTELKQGAADIVLQAELADNETIEEDEDDLSEETSAGAKMLQAELAENETSEEDDLDEDEEWTSDDDENTEEIGSTDESDEDTDEDNEESNTTGAVQMLQGAGMAEVANEDATTEDDDENTDKSDEDTDETDEESNTSGAVQMLQGTARMAEEANEDASTEDDDFSSDLPPEFDNIMVFSDAETESDIAPAVLEENQAAVASATKTAKCLDDSTMNAEQEEGSEEADATEKALKEVDKIVKSLDEFTFKDGGSEEMQKQQPQDYNSMSLRKLRTTYKKRLIAKHEGKQEEATEGKRLPLEEVDENASNH